MVLTEHREFRNHNKKVVGSPWAGGNYTDGNSEGSYLFCNCDGFFF